MLPIDHILVALLVFVKPVYSAVSYRRYVKRIEAGEKEADPVRAYRETQVLEWSEFAVLAIVWVYLSRDVADLGFIVPSGIGFLVCTTVVTIGLGLLIRSGRGIRKMSREERAKQIASLGDLVHFLPRDAREYRAFFRLSLTAGIVEEIVYRGFLIWYLSLFMPPWAAIIASSVVFGAGHAYQGLNGALRTGALGLGFAVLFVASGSLWLPMAAHALLDIIQGRMMLEIQRGE